MTPTELTQALHWRYATKAFDAKKIIANETFDALLDAARLSPSSFGLQPWKFLVVESKDLREKLRAQ